MKNKKDNKNIIMIKQSKCHICNKLVGCNDKVLLSADDVGPRICYDCLKNQIDIYNISQKFPKQNWEEEEKINKNNA
jgi:hypothetical protein